MDQQQIDKNANGAVKNVKSFASNTAAKIESALTDTLDEKIDALRGSTEEVLKRTEQLVKRHPFYAVLGAAAVGAVFASYVNYKLSSKR